MRALPSAALILFVFLMACSKRDLAQAQPCYAVVVDETSAIEIARLHDEFAHAHGLKRNASYKFMMAWDKKIAGQWEAEIFFHHVTKGASPMFLFAYDDSSKSDLQKAYQQFIDERIRPRWGGRQCSEVPGFKLPGTTRPAFKSD